MQCRDTRQNGAIYAKHDFRPINVNLTFFYTIFVSSHMYPENPEGTQVIVGSMNMGYISDTARNRTHNLFRPKRESIPLGHSDGHTVTCRATCLFIDVHGWPAARCKFPSALIGKTWIDPSGSIALTVSPGNDVIKIHSRNKKDYSISTAQTSYTCLKSTSPYNDSDVNATSSLESSNVTLLVHVLEKW